jgi:hypothetical protein
VALGDQLRVGAPDRVGELAGVQVQIPLGGFYSGVTKKSRDDVQVHSAGQGKGGVGVPPAQRRVGPGDRKRWRRRSGRGRAGPLWVGFGRPRAARAHATRLGGATIRDDTWPQLAAMSPPPWGAQSRAPGGSAPRGRGAPHVIAVEMLLAAAVKPGLVQSGAKSAASSVTITDTGVYIYCHTIVRRPIAGKQMRTEHGVGVHRRAWMSSPSDEAPHQRPEPRSSL